MGRWGGTASVGDPGPRWGWGRHLGSHPAGCSSVSASPRGSSSPKVLAFFPSTPLGGRETEARGYCCVFVFRAERMHGGSGLLHWSLLFQPLLPVSPGLVPGACRERWGPSGRPPAQHPGSVPVTASAFPANVKSAEQTEKRQKEKIKKKKPNPIIQGRNAGVSWVD